MILIGDVREAMGLETQRNIVDVIDRNKHKRTPYYLVVTANYAAPGSNDIKTVIALTSTKPPRMFGTICLYVDNQAGKIDKLWALPLDRPQVHMVDGVATKSIFYNAQGMPLADYV